MCYWHHYSPQLIVPAAWFGSCSYPPCVIRASTVTTCRCRIADWLYTVYLTCVLSLFEMFSHFTVIGVHTLQSWSLGLRYHTLSLHFVHHFHLELISYVSLGLHDPLPLNVAFLVPDLLCVCCDLMYLVQGKRRSYRLSPTSSQPIKGTLTSTVIHLASCSCWFQYV